MHAPWNNIYNQNIHIDTYDVMYLPTESIYLSMSACCFIEDAVLQLHITEVKHGKHESVISLYQTKYLNIG